MHPKQLALLEEAHGATLAECLRSPVATLNAGHLKAVLVEQLLRGGACVMERGSSASEAKLLRMVDEVVKVERHAVSPARANGGGRPPRPADLRLAAPTKLDLDLFTRSAMASPDRMAARALLDRVDALGAGTSDALLLACDRRGYDALRVKRSAEGEQPSVLATLCAALLPPSAELGTEPASLSPTLNGRAWAVIGAITPMVFGVQRVVVALRPIRRAGPMETIGAGQLDAFN